MTTLSVEDRALRMLAAGDSLNDITSSTGLTREEIEKLKRDFPGTHTQQPRPIAVPMRVGTGTPLSGVPTPSLSGAITDASPAPITLVTPDPEPTLSEHPPTLLERASRHSNTRIRNLGKRIQDQLEQLRDRLDQVEAAEQAKQEAAAEQTKARAEVAQLEAKLAAAKAKLRGPIRTGHPQTPAQAAAAAENLKRARQPADCDGCGRTFGHAGALGNHRKTCTGAA